MIVPHVDVILPYLKHPEQWLQNGALNALAVVVTDERCAEKIIPPMGELFQSTPRQSTTGGPLNLIRGKLPAANPKVRDLALKAIGGAYANYSGAKTWVGGQDLTGHRKETLEVLAGALTGVPGGYDMLYQQCQVALLHLRSPRSTKIRRFPVALPHRDLSQGHGKLVRAGL